MNSAPRRNRTYNLAHQLQAGDVAESPLSSVNPPENAAFVEKKDEK
jgi:hypothetical protein